MFGVEPAHYLNNSIILFCNNYELVIYICISFINHTRILFIKAGFLSIKKVNSI